jgi:maleylpyruvate isomerase
VADAVDDRTARQPSRLPGWTVGHLLTHLARNADAHTRVFEGAAQGEVWAMYPGGEAERGAAIEEGAGRPAGKLLADLVSARQRLEASWSAASHEAWATGLGARRAGPMTVADFVFLRCREVEVHTIDLGVGPVGAGDRWDALQPAYLEREWSELTAGLAARVPAGTVVVLVPGDRPSRAFGAGPEVVHVHATAGRILGWLLDRGEPGWPTLGVWSS